MKKPSGRRIAAVVSLLVALAIAVPLVQGWRAFGQRATGVRRARMEHSPQWRDGHFVNPQPLRNDWTGMIGRAFKSSPHRNPAQPPPTAALDPRSLQTRPATGLRVTWMGHSSVLVELDGYRVLTDPAWSPRESPLPWVGPRRWFAPPISLDDLPALDAVVISHDHYDHLDMNTVVALNARGVSFVVPLGVGAHLAYWGVPSERIVELDWWDHATVNGLEIVCTPARHASGRMLIDDDATLWAGWALIGPKHRVYYSGDTGLFPAMKTIGAELGPFDLTMIESGEYDQAWPDWHIGPEQAVTAHQWVRGKVLLPVHWGLFDLAFHGWTEPMERVQVAAQRAGVTVLAPLPGQSVEPEAPPPAKRWWPEVPWQTSEQNPVISSQLD